MDSQDIASDFIDLITERPIRFTIDERAFYIYPASLGRTLVCSRLLQTLNIDFDYLTANIALEALRLASTRPETLRELIAISTLSTREDIFNRQLIDERTEFLAAHLHSEELAKLFILAFNEIPLRDYKKYLKLDIEEQQRHRIAEVKDEDSSYAYFGARSILGSTVAPACKELGLTPRQVIWDISLSLLKMIQADMSVNIYISKEERKKLHISTDRNIIDGDGNDAWEQIKNLNWN